jgi:aminoglycoside phosphotransferase (APT) family kinase protein
MHADELEIDADLVRRLLASQFPQWAELPLARVPSAGTDNAIFRLGDELALRLPRIDWAAGQPERERELLPLLAPHLPLPVPVPVATGEPGEGYPWHWSIVPWLEGENATLERLADPLAEAGRIGEFVRALKEIDTAGRRVSGRGVPLARVDAQTRAALEQLHGAIDVAAAAAAWENALAAPAWEGPHRWSHGDLMSENMLAVDGRISAVIDFGALSVGDPACDLIVAWKLFPAGGPRDALRRAAGVDEATWTRARGWALASGLWALPYYVDTNPVLYGIARHSVEEVLAELS